MDLCVFGLTVKLAVNRGEVPGARIFASTRALVSTGCYGPSGFDPRWEMPKGGQVADGVDGVRTAVREQIAAGAPIVWSRLPDDLPHLIDRKRAGVSRPDLQNIRKRPAANLEAGFARTTGIKAPCLCLNGREAVLNLRQRQGDKPFPDPIGSREQQTRWQRLTANGASNHVQ